MARTKKQTEAREGTVQGPERTGEGEYLAGVGHLLPGTRDYAEARAAIKVFSRGQKLTVYNSYEQVIQVNVLIDALLTETDAEREELCNQARGMATILAIEGASTVPGVYMVW